MALTPVVIAINSSGIATAKKLASVIGAKVHGREGRVLDADSFFENTLDHARDLFAAGTPIIGVCASGILIRAVAPLLNNKFVEPPVISISDDGAVVVPLLGGHRGANRLARDIAKALSSVAAVTTAGDVSLGVSLDEPPLGWTLENPQHVKTAMSKLLSGCGALVLGDESAKWLNGLPQGNGLKITCSIFAQDDLGPTHLQFSPQRVTIGVGCSRGCSSNELAELVRSVLNDAGVCDASVHSVNTIDLKADEPAIIDLAKDLNAPLRLFMAHELEREKPRLATPSDIVFAEVGCHGVSEAAALAQIGHAGELWFKKRKSLNATVALGLCKNPLIELRGSARGRLSVVGIGPGQSAWRTPEVSRLIADAEELIGYGLYIDLLGSLAAGKIQSNFPLGGEEARCRHALEQAGKGKNVALVCSGDAGIYAMAALVFELLDRSPEQSGVSDSARRVEIICSPGVSALQAAAARGGAPLGHDFCTISLSDLLTPRHDILQRLNSAAEGDFVIALYNPVSKTRRTLFTEARNILLKYRPQDTPVMLASSLGRPEECVRFRKLKDLQVDEVDMLTVVLIGSSNSRLVQLGQGPRMFTPRGYARKIDGDLAIGEEK